jgi:hypothetical protein
MSTIRMPSGQEYVLKDAGDMPEGNTKVLPGLTKSILVKCIFLQWA